MSEQLPDTVNRDISEWCEPMPNIVADSESGLTTPGILSPKGFWVIGRIGGQFAWQPRYDFPESLDACDKFEALVEEREGMWFVYTKAFNHGYLDPNMTYYGWLNLRVTPEQRCAALLKVKSLHPGPIQNLLRELIAIA